MAAAVEFRRVCFSPAESRDRAGRLLLDSVSLAIEDGSTTAILGRSGSGKTTLMRTVNRMLEPTGGEVLVQGENVQQSELIALRRGIGYVVQETGLFPHFNVERNVGLVLEIEGKSREQRKHRSYELLSAVGLAPDDFAHRFPHQLSGGQRQRVGLARALAAEPKILLMDEPFGALDPLTRAEMQDMLLGLMKDLKKTVLIVTHDLDEALYLADQVALIEEGKLVACLNPAEFMKSNLPQVRSYVQAFHRGERTASSSRGESQ